MRIRMTEDRERRMRQLLQVTGENAKAKAIDRAIQHYLRDYELKQQHIEDMPDELVEGLSTPFLPLQRDVEHRVGPEE